MLPQHLKSTSTVSTKENSHCLLIKHSDGWNNDRCEQWLRRHGYTTETHISQNGKTLPDPDRFSHIIIYGGEPCINDATYRDCMRREMQFLETVLRTNTPCLGICLGAQLIAHVLGAAVKRLPCETVEFGYSVVTPTQAGHDFMQQPRNMLQWHSEGFDIPDDCQLLATGDLFPNQAFRYGSNIYGVQFHPEVTVDILRHWHSKYLHHSACKLISERCTRQLWNCHRHNAETTLWFSQFMNSWTAANQATSIAS